MNLGRFSATTCLLMATLVMNVHAAGFDNSFTTAKGDINDDGLTDIYVHSEAFTPPIDFVLQQGLGQQFNLITGLTSAQREALAQWASLPVSPRAADIDLDSNDDLLLGGLKQQQGLGMDLIVFGSSGNRPGPVGIVMVDEAFTTFFRQLIPIMENPSLLDAQLTPLPGCTFSPSVETVTIDFRDQGDEVLLELKGDSSGRDTNCYRYRVTEEYPFNPQAVVVAFTLKSILADGGLKQNSLESLAVGGMLKLLSNTEFLNLLDSQ